MVVPLLSIIKDEKSFLFALYLQLANDRDLGENTESISIPVVLICSFIRDYLIILSLFGTMHSNLKSRHYFGLCNVCHTGMCFVQLVSQRTAARQVARNIAQCNSALIHN